MSSNIKTTELKNDKTKNSDDKCIFVYDIARDKYMAGDRCTKDRFKNSKYCCNHHRHSTIVRIRPKRESLITLNPVEIKMQNENRFKLLISQMDHKYSISEAVEHGKEIFKKMLGEKCQNYDWNMFDSNEIIKNEDEIFFYICLKQVFCRISENQDSCLYYFKENSTNSMISEKTFSKKYKIRNNRSIIIHLKIDDLVQRAKELKLPIEFANLESYYRECLQFDKNENYVNNNAQVNTSTQNQNNFNDDNFNFEKFKQYLNCTETISIIKNISIVPIDQLIENITNAFYEDMKNMYLYSKIE